MDVGMGLADFINALRARGHEVRHYQIHYAISVGHIPRPPLDSSRRYMFSAADVTHACRYFGRPEGGANDLGTGVSGNLGSKT